MTAPVPLPLFPLAHADRIRRRAMLALELVDPVTGRLAGDALSVRAPGFAKPTVTRAGQFVWTDIDPPAARTVTIEALAKCGQFAPYAATVAVAERVPDGPVTLHRDVLVPTGLYEPPAGRLGAGGMLVEDVTADPRVPVADAAVRVMLQSARDATALDGGYAGATDARGGFVAIVGALGDDAPMPSAAPAEEGAIIGWIAFARNGTTRHSALLPMRSGRFYRAPRPFDWATLSPAPPPLPPAP